MSRSLVRVVKTVLLRVVVGLQRLLVTAKDARGHDLFGRSNFLNGIDSSYDMKQVSGSIASKKVGILASLDHGCRTGNSRKCLGTSTATG